MVIAALLCQSSANSTQKSERIFIAQAFFMADDGKQLE
jgi:hypothetical protein